MFGESRLPTMPQRWQFFFGQNAMAAMPVSLGVAIKTVEFGPCLTHVKLFCGSLSAFSRPHCEKSFESFVGSSDDKTAKDIHSRTCRHFSEKAIKHVECHPTFDLT
jgi:hypothetical protein